jgi:uncharacterized membrane protein
VRISSLIPNVLLALVGVLALAAVVARVVVGPAAPVAVALFALCTGVVVARAVPTVPMLDGWRTHRHAHLVVASVLAAAAFVLFSTWSVVRHARFGSGSWDLGCYNHNIWLFAHGRAFSTTAITTVLGDARFWGGTNHFMPSLVLAAPIAWLGSSSALLVVQAALIAACAFPLAWLCRFGGLGAWATAGVVGAVLFHVGTQSAANFDVHEIIPVPLLLYLAVVAVERKQRGMFVVWLLILVGTKESAILYGAGIGAWLLFCRKGWRALGAVVLVLCAVWFDVVTSVIQPALIEPGAHMIHVARFAALGSTMGEVLQHVLVHPLDALRLLVTPSEKLSTLSTTIGSFGFMPLFSPAAWLLALPNLAERFLSDKREMWGLGFHYSWVLVGIAGYGTLTTLQWLRRITQSHVSERRFDVAAGTTLVLATVLVQVLACPVQPELATLEKPYFASAVEVERYTRALAVIPSDTAVVAQNHFLPHLALREHVWLPEQRFIDKADDVVLDPRASAWPSDSAHIEGLVRALLVDTRFHVIFSESTTVVFSRRDVPAVPIDTALTTALTAALTHMH